MTGKQIEYDNSSNCKKLMAQLFISASFMFQWQWDYSVYHTVVCTNTPLAAHSVASILII